MTTPGDRKRPPVWGPWVVVGFAAVVSAATRIPHLTVDVWLVLLGLLVVVGGFAAVAVQAFRPWARLRVDSRRGQLVAGPQSWIDTYRITMVLAGLGAFSLAPVDDPMAAFNGFFLLFGLVWTVRLALRRPRVELTPTEVRAVHSLGTWRVPWEAISVGPRLTRPGWPELLTVDRADLLRRRGLVRRPPRAVQLPAVDVPVEFLARVINHYLDYPEERATIGTAAGYTRLMAVVLPEYELALAEARAFIARLRAGPNATEVSDGA